MSSTGSRIPIPVSGRGTTANATLLPNNQSSPEHHLSHHPHYQNHRSPSNRPLVQHSSSVPTTGTGFEMRVSAQQKVVSTTTSSASTTAVRPRFEAYMMTGDLIINLANTKSSDNIFFEQRVDDKFNIRNNTKRQRTTPNLHSTTLNVYKNNTQQEGSNSLPSSPCDTSNTVESDNQILSESPVSEAFSVKESSLPINQQQQSQQQQFNVRLSKSEDQLVQGTLTAVYGFCEVDNESVQSNSVDALLNNGATGRGEDKCKNESSSSPSSCSNNITNTFTSSPSNGEITNVSSPTAVIREELTPVYNRTSSLEEEESSVGRTNSSSRESSDTSASYTTTTATSPPDGAYSFNNSPTKAMSTATTTQQEQTESSMSEGYSVVSSLSGAIGNNPLIHHQQSHYQKQYQQVQTSHMSHNQRHLNSLSLSSSCESSNCSSPSPLEAGDEDGAAQKLQSTPRQTEKVSDFSCAKDVCLNQLSAIRVNDTNQSQLECNESPIRYPSFIVTQNKELSNLDETFEDASSPPPPFPNGPPPSTSSSENDSGSEDEIMDALNAYHYSPPKAVDTASASRLAKRLYNLEGFKKSDVSRHLSKNNDFSRAVAEEYLKFFDFSGDTLDGALRKFLGQFCLIGETQERERVLVHFSKRYLECNQGSFKSSDSVHTLTCALMLLNTDLHGENIGRRMTCGEFIENLAGLNEGDNFPRDVLRALYQSIKTQPLQWAMDDEADTNTATDKKSSGNGSPLSTNVVTVGHNPFLDVPNPNVATEYKKGYIMRKCCFDTSGKRTPFGKRGWKMFYATLRDLVLYLHKDEHGFRKNQLYESLHNSIRIHHALASRATDYTKKQFVFRLQTADGAEYLFQTSDARELQAWIEKINLVAASLSSPPLPSAVGSQTKKFQKPLLPVNHTKLSLRDQLIDHQTRKLKLEQELEELLTTHVEKGSSRRSLNEFAEKESYLQFELKRYQEYINLLQKKFQQTYGTQALDSIITVSNVSSAAKPSSKPLTTLSIGEELDDDNDEDGVPIIKRKSIR